MVIPDTPYFPYYQLLDKNVDFQEWWQQYSSYHTDYIIKGDTDLFPYLLETAPGRWYSRLVFNLYTPLARNTLKLFLPLSVDYESLLLGSAFGLFIAFRHFMDHRSYKTALLLPGGKGNMCNYKYYYYMRSKWEATRITPKKYIQYDRKMFWRKLRGGFGDALVYGVIATFFCHGFFAINFNWVERHFAIFIGTTFVTYDLYLYDEDYVDVSYNLYRHPELYALGLLMFHSVWRIFRNYVSNVPFRRVLIG